MAEFIPIDKIEWKLVKYLRQGETRNYDYEFWLNEPLASWDVWDYWERERIESMRTHLKQGNVLFDIGTEQGWCNLAYANMVGAENMVLIEPTKEFWNNIRALWDKNYSIGPKLAYSGLISTESSKNWKEGLSVWKESNGPLIDRNKYQYIHEHSNDIQSVTLDDLVRETGVVPDALTMDCEGAEILILKGARETIETYKPLIWASLHPDMALRDYNSPIQEVHDFLAELGYVGEYLATDHEEHWFFKPTGLL